MATLAPDRRWIEGNTEVCRILGRSGEELRRLRWDGVVDPDDRRAQVPWFQRAAVG